MVLGKLPVPGRPTIWMIVGQGQFALAEGAGGGCLDTFTLLYPFSHLSPSLWETARYRLKYCLQGPLNPKQPTNPGAGIGWLVILDLHNSRTRAYVVAAGGGSLEVFLSSIISLSLFEGGGCDGAG